VPIGPGQAPHHAEGGRLVEAPTALAPSGDMGGILRRVMIESAAERRSTGGRPARGRRGGRVNYGTIEHAGRPHRGRITDAEKEFVRTYLEEVNRRLRDRGEREIDPNDPDMKKRYGL
jgi:hypothetical protein